MNDAVVMTGPLCLIAAGSKGGGCELQGSVVGDIKPPIVDQPWSLRRLKIAFSDREQIDDFVPAWLVLLQPTVLLPVA